MKKIRWLFILLGIGLIAYFGYNYLYQDHRDIEKESAQFALTSVSLIEEFKKNSALAETKYLNKTIQVSGKITEINTTEITLDDYIFTSSKTSVNQSELKLNTTIIIKGRFIGYDDLLEQVKLDQCSIKK